MDQRSVAYFRLDISACHQISIFGKRHLDYLVTSFADYYSARRSRMEREHLPPVREESDDAVKFRREVVEIESYVGGLVPSFERRMA